MPLKIKLEKEIILPEGFISKKDFDELKKEGNITQTLISDLEYDIENFLLLINGLKGIIKGFSWTEKAPTDVWHKNEEIH